MRKLEKETASQKENSGVIHSVLSVSDFIPVIVKPVVTTPGCQPSAVSVAAAVPAFADVKKALNKTIKKAEAETPLNFLSVKNLPEKQMEYPALAESIRKSAPKLFTWHRVFPISFYTGLMKTGAKEPANNLSIQGALIKQIGNICQDESTINWAKLTYAVKYANPKYKKGDKQWEKNCQCCIIAFEARMRDYNVIAKPYSEEHPERAMLYNEDGYLSVFIPRPDPDATEIVGKTSKECMDNIAEKMKKWGEGSRAIVRVKESNKDTGHVFIAVQIQGEVQYVEPQIGEMNAEVNFENIDPSQTKLIRIDNLDIDKERAKLFVDGTLDDAL